MCKSLPSLVFLDCLEGLVGQKKGESFSSLSLLTVNLERLEAKGQKRGPKLKCKVVFLSHYFATVFVRQTYLARNASKWLGRCHCFLMACQENALLCRRNMILGSLAHPIPVKVGCGFPRSRPLAPNHLSLPSSPLDSKAHFYEIASFFPQWHHQQKRAAQNAAAARKSDPHARWRRREPRDAITLNPIFFFHAPGGGGTTWRRRRAATQQTGPRKFAKVCRAPHRHLIYSAIWS